VANFDGSRCSGAPVIPRRSSFEWRQDPDADAFVVLVLKRRREYVREVRVTKRRQKVHKVDRKGVKGYWEPVVSSITVAVQRFRVAQPGGIPVRVFERGGVRRGRGLYGGGWRGRGGKGSDGFGTVDSRRSSRARVVFVSTSWKG
jgi:hypothetical protein